MRPNEFEQLIESAAIKLLEMARKSTWNKIHGNCSFILSEERNCNQNGFERMRARNMENSKKKPLPLRLVLPELHMLYSNLHDINLYIYKAKKKGTVIDIRYYLKTSLSEAYRQQVLEKPSMLHCKISIPPWISDKKEKFDINWEVKPLVVIWHMLLLRARLK